MNLSSLKKFLGRRFEQLSVFCDLVAYHLLITPPIPCSINDEPSVVLKIYSHDGPSAYQSELFYFKDNDAAHLWIDIMKSHDCSSNWSHAHISGDLFVAFNDSGATPDACTFGYSNHSWNMFLMHSGTTAWSVSFKDA